MERDISTEDLITLISSEEIIKEYPDDEPCPSVFISLVSSKQSHTTQLSQDARIISRSSQFISLPEDDKYIEYRRRRNEP